MQEIESEVSQPNNGKSSFNFTTVVLIAIVAVSLAVAAYFVVVKKNNATVHHQSSAATNQQNPQEQLKLALDAAQKQPNVPNFVNLGLAYFNNGNYIESIAINMQVLQLDSNNAVAFNNICAAYNNLGRYEEAIYFGKKAIEKDAGNQLAKNNIAFAEKQIKRIAELQQKVAAKATKEEYVELGIYYYKRKEFKQAIEVFEKGLVAIPKDLVLLNNMCASYCEIKQWEKAMPYCEEALKLQPDYSLAKNNLQWAKDGKAGKYN
jgi:tetratricopeptide (TPR) repeat protein